MGVQHRFSRQLQLLSESRAQSYKDLEVTSSTLLAKIRPKMGEHGSFLGKDTLIHRVCAGSFSLQLKEAQHTIEQAVLRRREVGSSVARALEGKLHGAQKEVAELNHYSFHSRSDAFVQEFAKRTQDMQRLLEQE